MVDFDFAYSAEQGVLWPTGEGRVQAAKSIDRYGDADLMAEFAREYLKQHWVLLRRGRLPHTLVEVMPPLLLLVTAAELGLKAFRLRSEGEQVEGHDLVELYDGLDVRHQTAVESRFGRCEMVAGLASIGVGPPQVRELLGGYSDVYEEARYFAEPTTRLRGGLRGANMIKAPAYPIFMPYLVEAIVECYPSFSGAERLRRRGAEVSEHRPEVTSYGHGEWTLRPASLGLAVLMASQKDGMDNPDFIVFKAQHPTSLEADWMYGGSTLLFYDLGGAEPRDGVETVSGIECRIISQGQVRLHSRDLDRLAEKLEAIEAGDEPLGSLYR